MKKVLLSILFMTLSYAQEIKQVSQISVTGSKSYSRSGHYHRHGTNKGNAKVKKKMISI
jgi:cell division septal protein FtsQ